MYDCTKTNAYTEEQLEKCRERLAKMSTAELQMFYNSCLHMCQLNYAHPPSATYVQQLVQAWRELVKRERHS
jgi:hypothetical protein